MERMARQGPTPPRYIRYHLAGIWTSLSEDEKRQLLPIIVTESLERPTLDVFIKIFEKYYAQHPKTVQKAFSNSIAKEGLFKEDNLQDDLFDAIEGGFELKFQSVLDKLHLSSKGELLGIAPQHLYEQTLGLVG